MKKENITKVFKSGSKQTETTHYYRDGKLHAILCVTKDR